MTGSARTRRVTAWLAALAVLLAGLLPGLAQALATGDGRDGATRWIEVCSHGGSTWVAVNDNDQPASTGGAGQASGTGCPYCLLATAFAPGPQPAAVPRVFASLPAPGPTAWAHMPSGAPWTAGTQRAPPRPQT